MGRELCVIFHTAKLNSGRSGSATESTRATTSPFPGYSLAAFASNSATVARRRSAPFGLFGINTNPTAGPGLTPDFPSSIRNPEPPSSASKAFSKPTRPVNLSYVAFAVTTSVSARRVNLSSNRPIRWARPHQFDNYRWLANTNPFALRDRSFVRLMFGSQLDEWNSRSAKSLELFRRWVWGCHIKSLARTRMRGAGKGSVSASLGSLNDA